MGKLPQRILEHVTNQKIWLVSGGVSDRQAMLDAVEIFYSFDDKEYVMMRNAWLQDNTPVHVGLMAASPDGNGFNATFEHFKVKHLPDLRRQEWLKKNAE